MCRCDRVFTGSLACSVLGDTQDMRPWMVSLNWVYRVSQSLPSILEPVEVYRGDGKRPDSIIVFPFSQDRSMFWDTTCTDTHADTNIYNWAVTVGQAARDAEEGSKGCLGLASSLSRSQQRQQVCTKSPQQRSYLRSVNVPLRQWKRAGRLVDQRISLVVQRVSAFSTLTAVRKKHNSKLRACWVPAQCIT